MMSEYCHTIIKPEIAMSLPLAHKYSIYFILIICCYFQVQAVFAEQNNSVKDIDAMSCAAQAKEILTQIHAVSGNKGSLDEKFKLARYMHDSNGVGQGIVYKKFASCYNDMNNHTNNNDMSEILVEAEAIACMQILQKFKFSDVTSLVSGTNWNIQEEKERAIAIMKDELKKQFAVIKPCYKKVKAFNPANAKWTMSQQNLWKSDVRTVQSRRFWIANEAYNFAWNKGIESRLLTDY